MMSDNPPSSSSLQQQITDDLRAIVTEIERLTGMLSQWSGEVEIVTGQNRSRGGKTFACVVRIRADMVQTDLRWPILIHEAFHCFSVERNADASVSYLGYEEGVVEQLQPLFRSELLTHLGVTIAPEMFVDRDTDSAYTNYIAALESMRTALGTEPKPFYLELLGTPLEQRWALLRERAARTSLWNDAVFRRRWREWEQILLDEV
jgi:hypothetical protein